MILLRYFGCFLILSTFTACTSVGVPLGTEGHLPSAQVPPPIQGDIPSPVTRGYSLPAPKVQPRLETYSVVVSNVKVQELLFSLARDAKVNVDIHPGLTGVVTLNAINQTLPQILDRISKQIDMRFELDGENLAVMPDTPFLRTYKIDYVNMSRDASGSVGVATQIAVAGAAASGDATKSGSGSQLGDNNSSTRIDNVSKNHFWDTLLQNLKDLLRETDKQIVDNQQVCEEGRDGRSTKQDNANAANGAPSNNITSSTSTNAQQTSVEQINSSKKCMQVKYIEAAAVIANPETGVVTVRATARQQEKIQEFLGHVMNSAQRQVLIEATIAEVTLSQSYQQGVDWSKISLSGYGLSLVQGVADTLVGNTLQAPTQSIFALKYNSKGGSFSGAVNLLESFGDVKVLSSPKISVMNNQTAVLKVVDNAIYFTVQSDTNQNQTQSKTTYTTSVHSIPIGLVLNVTPQISGNDVVLLNLRPSLSRIVGSVTDPNPALKENKIVNTIPIVRSREMESVLRIDSGNIAVMGGLMEDMIDNTTDSVPGLGRLPILGGIFQNRNDTKTKTELIIFLRPTVIHDANINGDYRSLKNLLPKDDFFDKTIAPNPVKILEQNK